MLTDKKSPCFGIVTLLVLLVVLACGGRVCMAGEITAWGDNNDNQLNVPSPNADFVAVAAGYLHSLGLKADGSIAAWGGNDNNQLNVPSPNADFVAVAGCFLHSLGLKADGSIAAWGWNGQGQCTVPSPNADFIAIAAGDLHSLGLKANGSIVAWGGNGNGQRSIPSPNANFVAIAAGGAHSLGLKADGSIAAWGWNDDNQCNVPDPNTDFVAVAAGYYHSLGLKSDGSIVAWGDNEYGQCNIPSPNTDFIAVAASEYHSLGLKADGSIAAWGYDDYGEGAAPSPNADFVAITAGGYHNLGLKAESMGTAFTYQGQLYDSDSPAGGTYDFQFGLYDSGNIQQGNTLSMDDIDVIDGYFTAELDFGSDVFNGFARLLEVAVRPGQSSEPNDFVTLSPRHEITPAPYASYASYAMGTRGISVDDDGNVGIGTTTPAGKLDVNGSIYQRGGSLHADYVFAPGYDLESIQEHSRFMWQNKHLKAIPKATSDANGKEMLELGAHRKGIVEELEKAHIYIDQLNKENKEIKKQLTEIMEILSKSSAQQEGVTK